MKMPVLVAALTVFSVSVLPAGALADDILRNLGAAQGVSAEQQKKIAAARAKALEHQKLLRHLEMLRNPANTKTRLERRREAREQLQNAIRRQSGRGR